MPPEGRSDRLEAWIGSSDERQLLELYREIYRALMRTSLDTILIADAGSGHIVDANAAAQKLLGRPIEELVGMHQTELHPPDATELYAAIFDKHRQRQHTVEVGRPVVQRANGERVPIEIEAGTVHSGERALVTGVFRDLSPSDSERSARLRAETRFKDLVENSPVGIYIIRQGRFAYVNPMFCEISGCSSDRLYRLHSVLELVHPEDRSVVAGNLRRRELGEAETIEYGFRALHGPPPPAGSPDERRVIHVEALGTRSQTVPGDEVEIVGTLTDVTDRLAAQHALERAARFDDLTGLHNRHEMQRLLAEAFELAPAEGGSPVFVLLDLDQFTSVNDTAGHAGGDVVLSTVGQLLETLAPDATIARWGDDEFALLLPPQAPESALLRSEELRVAVRSQRITLGDEEIRVTASIGVVPIDAHGDDLARLLTSMHSAIRSARDQGGDAVVLAASPGRDAALRREEGTWRLRLRDALEEDGFTLFAQAIVPLTDRGEAEPRPVLEVLLRLPTPEGLATAGRFIPLAERLGIIRRIDRWVLDRVWTVLSEARSRGVLPLPVLSVNLSPRSIDDPEFRQAVLRRVSGDRELASSLRLEITETTALRNLAEIRKFTEMLHELGCTFFIDDFGSGANSVMYLTLPVSALKIDGHLIRQILVDPHQKAVARAYIDLARRMGLRTVAEGVESESLHAALRELGVDSVQGFAVARPRPLDEVLTSLGSIPAVWRPTASDEARA